ncbi:MULTISPECIES: carboxylating nicotinate-nucleotide diphosphorylase [Lactococcus]|uniref:Probable nicotinate-nucleotide pyrophosphorylase [carboxylating] n=1 Tax=Lactococcus formosensis TaxID=1281486 RepID=A0A9X4SFN4_9LACT|nr:MULTISPECIES: carboxylating nicotinate-nucleotide diphosphorylase [Lactococcus]MDG6112487.1 carboxylating nicotinate-nucleotide diphosphorylase [Lactococcus formosensis]MDG6114541.1 carboxylating nicotinate-nucleotide diphosphorylase [Lactococcus formosensis]MDG6116685.1 carboxylating nicotinate-nucleotide diphosphorylase [Lactococcus formosensis]MDG6118739.1 carboxylating nicotinate-nucleotide diphosphorylase [Lactococcus formosensis]MDG6120767.1 carboxylating nicotinate-nucleotide diphosp
MIKKNKLMEYLLEDIGGGDISTELIFEKGLASSGVFLAKEDGIIAGLEIPQLIYEILGNDANFTTSFRDGDEVRKGDIIGYATGEVRTMLTGERVILNLMQRMSGIATQTSKAIQLLNDSKIRICDTRKTMPGLRLFDKQAVKIGGGYNHRMGLYDGVMLKDNHIAYCGNITNAVKKVKESLGHMIKIEVEIESQAQVEEAVTSGVDIIMFDNRSPEEIRNWIHLIPPTIITEISGGITLENISHYRGTGVNYISLGAVTHSAVALDISFNSSEGVKKVFSFEND